MITEAIVLAGGLGTRLKAVVTDLPKCLAPVAGRPFLAYLLDHAKKQGIEKFIFALGYKTEQIETFVRKYLPEGTYDLSIEKKPLGTGGAIYKACKQSSSANIIVLNADTYYGISYPQLAGMHEQRKAACTLALKPMKEFERYGAVDMDEENTIRGFREKKYQSSGLVNGGVYALRVESFIQKSFPETFSFEKDYLEPECLKGNILGLVSDAYFIDIGVPEDYQRAQQELIAHI